MSNLIKVITIACFTISFGLMSFTSYADPSHKAGKLQGQKGHPHTGEKPFKIKKHKEKSDFATKFSAQDKTHILEYFNAHPFPTTTLPPGIAKNLARGKPLPPGIAKKYLPKDVLSLLPTYPGYEYLVAGKNILLVNATTRIIADILPNLLK